MKTAMQELIEWLEKSSDIKNDILNWETVKENVLEKEIKQLEQKYSDGYYLAKNEAISILEKNF